MTSQRTHFGGKDGPGPGEYEPFCESQVSVEHANIEEEGRVKMDARLPRYHEWVAQQEEKKVDTIMMFAIYYDMQNVLIIQLEILLTV